MKRTIKNADGILDRDPTAKVATNKARFKICLRRSFDSRKSNPKYRAAKIKDMEKVSGITFRENRNQIENRSMIVE